MPISDTTIKNLKPREKPYKVSDFGGLYIEVQPNGSRLWRLKYRYERREKRLSFGKYPIVSLAKARKLRDEAKELLAGGHDPGVIKQEAKNAAASKTENTFGKFSDAFLDKSIREGRAPATQSKNEWLLGKAKSDFGDVPLQDVTAPMVLACLRKVEAKGNHESAQRLRAKISAVFRFAIASGVVDFDPAQALSDALIKPQTKSRAAITDRKAFGGLLRAIDAFEGQLTTRFALQLLALLAQRPGELRAAEWCEFDLDARVWTIPAARMKMRSGHKVPLAQQAVSKLTELRSLTGSGRLLFPGLRTVHRPMSENTLNAALRRMGYSGEEMTSHGFRASFSTFANESGLWHPDAIERHLAHVERNAVRKAYDRATHWEERVRLMDWWAEEIDQMSRKVDGGL